MWRRITVPQVRRHTPTDPRLHVTVLIVQLVALVARWRLAQRQELIEHIRTRHEHGTSCDAWGVYAVRLVLPSTKGSDEEGIHTACIVRLTTVAYDAQIAGFEHCVVQGGFRIPCLQARICDLRGEGAIQTFMVPAIATAFGTAHRPADLIDDVAFFAQAHDDATAGVGVDGEVVQVQGCNQFETHGKLLITRVEGGTTRKLYTILNKVPTRLC